MTCACVHLSMYGNIVSAAGSRENWGSLAPRGYSNPCPGARTYVWVHVKLGKYSNEGNICVNVRCHHQTQKSWCNLALFLFCSGGLDDASGHLLHDGPIFGKKATFQWSTKHGISQILPSQSCILTRHCQFWFFDCSWVLVNSISPCLWREPLIMIARMLRSCLKRLDGIINLANPCKTHLALHCWGVNSTVSYLVMFRRNCWVNASSSQEHKRSIAMLVNWNTFCVLLPVVRKCWYKSSRAHESKHSHYNREWSYFIVFFY
jgi:hypothetical protein